MRNREIDFLRGLAILLVLFRHHTVFLFIYQGGGVGVDLFFVLSGFLIGGLLFEEYKRHGNLEIGRFLIRRGFKIYPSYYAALSVTIIWLIIASYRGYKAFPLAKTIYNLVFLQNYFDGIIGPTWSLAVEEHFYFLLPVLLLWFIAKNTLKRGNAFPRFFIAVGIVCLAGRILTAKYIGVSLLNLCFPTHLRIDSLLFGVLISYYYHFKDEQLTRFYNKYRLILLISSTALIIPFFMNFDAELPFRDRYIIFTIGFTALYYAFGVWLVAMVKDPAVSGTLKKVLTKPVYNFVAFTGFYSYNIYLWHNWAGFIADIDHYPNIALFHEYPKILALIYFVMSYALGIGITHALEIPFLKIRDKYFPRRARPV
ncbi:MAG: acyltransferase [Bacteroidota bacterium]